MSSPGPGIIRQLICTALSQGRAQTINDVKRMLASKCGGEQADQIVATMIRDGLLVRITRGRLRVTQAGAKLVPSTQPPFARGTYVPPQAPPRRSGADDHARLPSVFSGFTTPWRHPL